MTSQQLEHLRLIDAHLAKLLAVAEKRTPGEWEHCQQNVWLDNEGSWITCPNLYANAHHNATFIASCAGNAEAGWKATRAAIAGHLKASVDDSWAVSLVASEVLEAILAAFPLELVKP